MTNVYDRYCIFNGPYVSEDATIGSVKYAEYGFITDQLFLSTHEFLTTSYDLGWIQLMIKDLVYTFHTTNDIKN